MTDTQIRREYSARTPRAVFVVPNGATKGQMVIPMPEHNGYAVISEEGKLTNFSHHASGDESCSYLQFACSEQGGMQGEKIKFLFPEFPLYEDVVAFLAITPSWSGFEDREDGTTLRFGRYLSGESFEYVV